MNTTVSALDRVLQVLHLEDNPEDRRLIHRWLREQNFATDCTVVDNRADFVKALEQKTFDIILSDKNLPGFDGSEALHFVREKHPTIPFVFVSGSMGEEAAIETIKDGATDYVLKDRLSRLIPAIQRAIREAEHSERSRQAEKKIREQAALLDKAQDAIMVSTFDQRLHYWNKSAERLYGWTSAEAIGQNVAALLFQPQSSEMLEAAFRTILVKDEWTGEFAQVTKSGNNIIVESRWTLVRDQSGQPDFILVVNTDITGKKSLEEQFLRAQRLESIGALASGIAHDLNNCLSPIIMGAAVLKDLVPDPSWKKILVAMESSAIRGAGVVKQVLTFARGTVDKRVVLQPNHLIHEMIKIIRETFPRSIQIKSECAPNLWPIDADATQIHQILLNLCVNARDAMPDGGTLTLISGNVNLDAPASLAGLSGPPGPYVRIDVKDTGAGIPPEIQQKIFEPFFTTKEVGKGTGLGLSTTVSILTSHHALLGLQSAPGIGTTFSLWFPKSVSSVEVERPDESLPMRKGTQDLILLVDDEAAIREMCKFLLESCNYRVLVAENGAQALACFQQHKDELSLVVTDSNMPVMGGSTAVRAMRWSAPHLKIIATSGGGGREDDILASDPTSYRFLPKPYTAERLLALISELLPKEDTTLLHKPATPNGSVVNLPGADALPSYQQLTQAKCG